ncbi:MAG: PilN domain-containing protein [Deltaproteobacteria bacterium]|nr:PilN domain-containing protein [Deltaproteobacteria bacterium]
MIKINLLPVRQAKKKESMRRQIAVAALGSVLLFMILGVSYASILVSVSGLKDVITNEEKEVVRLDKEIGELKNLEAERKVVLDKLNIVKQLEINKRQHLKLFADIAGSVPDRLWLDSLKDVGPEVVIIGFASGDDVVAEFMRALEKNLASWKIELEVVNQVEKESRKLSSFTIKLERPKEKEKEAAPKAGAKPTGPA